MSIHPVDGPSLNGRVLHPGISSSLGLSMNLPCSLISCQNRSISVLSGLGGVWPAMFVESAGFTILCNAGGLSSGPIRTSSSRCTAIGAPNTKLTTWLTMKRIRRGRVTILCRRICVGYESRAEGMERMIEAKNRIVKKSSIKVKERTHALSST